MASLRKLSVLSILLGALGLALAAPAEPDTLKLHRVVKANKTFAKLVCRGGERFWRDLPERKAGSVSSHI